MVEYTEGVQDTIVRARMAIIENGYDHISTAVTLFKEEHYASACFSAMTAIEEGGKLRLLGFLNNVLPEPDDSVDIDSGELRSILGDHTGKALHAAGAALCVNSGADRRHGTHPDNELDLKYGILLLARAGNRWMSIRNGSLYTDVNIHSQQLKSPNDRIDVHYAYYFICMAYEVIAELAEFGLGSALEGRDPTQSHKFLQACLDELGDFTEQYGDEFAPRELGFFTDPQLQEHVEEINISLYDRMTDEEIEATREHMIAMNELMDQETSDDRQDIIDNYPESAPNVSVVCKGEMARLAESVNEIISR